MSVFVSSDAPCPRSARSNLDRLDIPPSRPTCSSFAVLGGAFSLYYKSGIVYPCIIKAKQKTEFEKMLNSKAPSTKSVIRRKRSSLKKRPLSYASTDLLTIEVPKKKINRRNSLLRLKEFFSLKKNFREISNEKGLNVFRRSTSIHSIEFWES